MPCKQTLLHIYLGYLIMRCEKCEIYRKGGVHYNSLPAELPYFVILYLHSFSSSGMNGSSFFDHVFNLMVEYIICYMYFYAF